MIKVFTAPNVIDVEVVRGELESRGVATLVNNELVGGYNNGVGFAAIWPELWVVDEADGPLAREIIAGLNDPPAAPAWTCPRCGEEVEGQFLSCWSCGLDRPA